MLHGVDTERNNYVICMYIRLSSEDDDIKTIEFFYNGKNYKITEDAIKKSQNAKKVSYKLTLEKGKNTLIVKETTQNGGTAQEGWTYEKK